jgi:hypothetical protein
LRSVAGVFTRPLPYIEKTITVKEHERERYDFDTTMFYENRFWNRRPDGMVIIKNHRTLYILEFKRSSVKSNSFLRVKEHEAIEQHKSIIEALKAAAPEWTFEQINFVAGRRGAVVEDNLYNKLEKLNVQALENGQDSFGACATHMRSA